ncbi:IS3 family transposase, partial [Branchiibius sp. NY16-3462-2]|uniref:IS3 family transposase n=1 Tax=Branchiibius sp. NY16-3462-2 TaxID=1807500 RepID=UPI00079C2A66
MAALAGLIVQVPGSDVSERVTVAAACRALNVSPSSYYDWVRGRPPSDRDLGDAYALDTIIDIHARSRGTYGVRRVHAELCLGGHEHAVSRRRVARLMATHQLAGVHRRRWRNGGPRDAASWPDHVNRQFVAERPDRLWVTDITQHRTGTGWVYCAVVLDVFSRRVVGWSIADHLRTELVIDALDMARAHRKPIDTIVHSDRGTQYTSWLFGSRLRQAGLLGSMGKVA